MNITGQTSIIIGETSGRKGAIYWGVVAIVSIVFLATTMLYWLGTIDVINENMKPDLLPYRFKSAGYLKSDAVGVPSLTPQE